MAAVLVLCCGGGLAVERSGLLATATTTIKLQPTSSSSSSTSTSSSSTSTSSTSTSTTSTTVAKPTTTLQPLTPFDSAKGWKINYGDGLTLISGDSNTDRVTFSTPNGLYLQVVAFSIPGGKVATIDSITRGTTQALKEDVPGSNPNVRTVDLNGRKAVRGDAEANSVKKVAVGVSPARVLYQLDCGGSAPLFNADVALIERTVASFTIK